MDLPQTEIVVFSKYSIRYIEMRSILLSQLYRILNLIRWILLSHY